MVASAEAHHEISHGSDRATLTAIDKWYCEKVNEFLLDLKNTQKHAVPGVPPYPMRFNGQFVQMDVVSVMPPQ